MCTYVHVEPSPILFYIPSRPLAGFNQRASTLPHGDVDATGEKTGIEKGTQDYPRHTLSVVRVFGTGSGLK
jgi:hypothetical protein